MRRLLLPLLPFALFACGDDEPSRDTSDTSDVAETSPADVPDDVDTAEPDASDTTGDTTSPFPPEGPCDPLDPSHCLLPFPSSLYLEADPTRETGFTLEFGAALPRNSDGRPVDPTAYRRLDGFGVGTPLIVSFPNLDTAGLATEYNTDPSLALDAEILWFEVTGTGLTRFPYFIDKDLQDTDPASRLLIVRPAAIMKEATRYIVAFRGLKNTSGTAYPKSPAFAALLSGATSSDPALAARQSNFDDIFSRLGAAGVDPTTLQLAWDFTTASCDALHGKMLHMLDDAMDEVGEDGPELTDIVVEELEHEHWALEIRGNFRVPHYMKEEKFIRSDELGWVFNLPGNDPKALPVQNGTAVAPFWARIPKSALTLVDGKSAPHGLVMYGHGQNGLGTQVRGGFNARIANENNLIFFATDMWGMSENDVGGIIDMLSDMSGFPRLSDRLHQGIINHALLARAFKARFADLTEVSSRGIAIDPSRLFYSGISQGGIYGAVFVAVSPDLQRGHLGVPGNNYSYLLARSRNFAPFFLGLAGFYQERWQQVVLLQVIQQLWEGADPVSYMRHLSAEPFPNQGANHVLLAPAKGDVQVAVTSNEWLARSGIGIPVLAPYDVTRTMPSGAETATYPHTGSGIVLYDFGNPWPDESVNLPPTSEARDPHGDPRNNAAHNRQLVHFLETGEIIDVCSDDGTPGCAPN